MLSCYVLTALSNSPLCFRTAHRIPQGIERHLDTFLCGLLDYFIARVTFLTRRADLCPNGLKAIPYFDQLSVFRLFRQRIQPAS